jgi:hypothetical protein
VLEIDGADDKVDGGEGIDTLVANSSYGLKINLTSGFVDYNRSAKTGPGLSAAAGRGNTASISAIRTPMAIPMT